jgi:hypothetical protein
MQPGKPSGVVNIADGEPDEACTAIQGEIRYGSGCNSHPLHQADFLTYAIASGEVRPLASRRKEKNLLGEKK